MITSTVTTRTGADAITAYTTDEIALPPLRFDKYRKAKKTTLWARNFAVFDTETSHNHDTENPVAWVYQWAFLLSGRYVYGRTPSEFVALLEKLRSHYSLGADKKIIIYVHNLAYDGQYLKHYLRQYAGDQLKILATDNHSYLYIDVPGIRFLCSYRLTGLSLDTLSKDYAKTYLKATGTVDYDVIRYQDTELTEVDWHYMFSDVASQHDAITQYLRAQGYEYAYKAPMTSTGFVRTDCRHASEKVRSWREDFEVSALDLPLYMLMRQGFQGGVTICSYAYSGSTVRGKLGHVDFTSSYPAQQMLKYFPQGKFNKYGEVESTEELQYLLNNKCCIFLLTLTGVKIRPGVTAPFLPSSKCLQLDNPLRLNGKVVSADRLSIVCTEIDYAIYTAQYTYETQAVDLMYTASRGRLPAWLREKVMQYFRAKCELKQSDPLLYMASKAKLNGIYGMTATAIVRDEYEVSDDLQLEKKPVDAAKALAAFYRSYNSFLPYQYGVWTTAHARKALFDLITTIGYDNFLYCDTDSVFYIEESDTQAKIDAYNAQIRERAAAAGAIVGDKVLGLAEREPELTAFRGLHAKCYAMIEEGELKVTIAGIPKSAIKWKDGKPVKMTNAQELGEIDNLKDGFVFRHCGGTRALYVEDLPRTEQIDGHRIECASSVIICPIEKEISDTMYTIGADYSFIDLEQRAF